MSETIGIAGSGTIACGLAVVAAETGHDVKLRARSDTSVAGARHAIEKGCKKAEDGDAVLARIEVTDDIGVLGGCSVVVEAVAEDYDAKGPLLAQVADVASADALLASTTSSLSINQLAAEADVAERFVGFHVFNPVPVMKLVEIVYPDAATDATKQRARDLCEALGKTGVEVPDTPGFVVNRLLFPYLFDAAKFQHDTGLDPESVDTCMKLGAGLPMGPLALLDYVGMDVSIAIGESIGLTIPDNCLALLAQGKLGRKSGQGFFEYAR